MAKNINNNVLSQAVISVFFIIIGFFIYHNIINDLSPTYEMRIFSIEHNATESGKIVSEGFSTPAPVTLSPIITPIVKIDSNKTYSFSEKDFYSMIGLFEDMKIMYENTHIKLLNDNLTTVSDLSDFYAVLFTIVAVLVAIIGAASFLKWNEEKKEIQKIQKAYEQLLLYKEKQEYAEKAIEIFEKDADNKITGDSPLEDDPQFTTAVKELLNQESTNDGWLRLILAKNIKEKHSGPKNQQYFKRIEKIYHHIELVDTDDGTTDLRTRLYHLLGKLYWEWYKFIEEEIEIIYKKNKPSESWMNFLRSRIENEKIYDWISSQNDNDIVCGNSDKLNGIISCPYKSGYSIKELLHLSATYYKKSIELETIDASSSYGNLALVLIEQALLLDDKRKTLLEEAQNQIDKIRGLEYNHYWTMLKIDFYKNNHTELNPQQYEQLENKILHPLLKNKNQQDFFFQEIQKELHEPIENRTYGFPGKKTFEKIKCFFLQRNEIVIVRETVYTKKSFRRGKN